jgi:hypothetical protein
MQDVVIYHKVSTRHDPKVSIVPDYQVQGSRSQKVAQDPKLSVCVCASVSTIVAHSLGTLRSS